MGMSFTKLTKCADLLLKEVEDNFETIEFFDLVEAWQDFVRMDVAIREEKLRKFACHLIEDGLDRHNMRVMALMVTEDLKGRNAVNTIVERCHKALLRMPPVTTSMRDKPEKAVEPEESEDAAPEKVQTPILADDHPYGVKEHGIKTPDQLVMGGHRKPFCELKHEVEVWMDVQRQTDINCFDIPEPPKRGRPRKSKTPNETPENKEWDFYRNRDRP